MNKFKEELIHSVIKHIVADIKHSYYEGIEELLNHIGIYELVAFLPEEQREKWNKSIV